MSFAREAISDIESVCALAGRSIDDAETGELVVHNGERENGLNDLWSDENPDSWRAALCTYDDVIASQRSKRLPSLDRWYREELPSTIDSRQPSFLKHEELVRLTEWKMARGVWRQRNLILVRSNAPEVVEKTSEEALSSIPDAKKPISILSRLSGVGPATASAVAAAVAPETYPFFDDRVAAQIDGIGKIGFTAAFYGRYSEAIRARAGRLGAGWTPAMVERALWANAGGKAGLGR